MRVFDTQASTPNRFRQRGYSGVQENRTRADFQRRLRMLDTSLQESMAEWANREGVPLCKDGAEYRGAELLPANHTHMYAWTGKQMAQKQESQGNGHYSPRESITESQRSPRQHSVQVSARRSTDFTLGANSPRGMNSPTGASSTRPPAGTATPRTNRGSPGPKRNATSPVPRSGATRNSTGTAPSPLSARRGTGPPVQRRVSS